MTSCYLWFKCILQGASGLSWLEVLKEISICFFKLSFQPEVVVADHGIGVMEMNKYSLSTRNCARHSIYIFLKIKISSTCRIGIATPSYRWTNRQKEVKWQNWYLNTDVFWPKNSWLSFTIILLFCLFWFMIMVAKTVERLYLDTKLTILCWTYSLGVEK